MTQKEFERTKEWLEKVTNLEFDGINGDGEKEAIKEDECAIFSKDIYEDGQVNVYLQINDDFAKVWIARIGYEPIDIIFNESPNQHLTAEVFASICHNN